MDNPQVSMITIEPTHDTSVLQIVKENKKGKDVRNPKCIIAYNFAAKGVDYSNEMSSYSSG